jgi:hypothetical protein
MLSAILLMLEVQTKWWKPALRDIGWHSALYPSPVPTPPIRGLINVSTPFLCCACDRIVGFWNLVGAVGFMICGAFGYSPVERWVTQSALSTFWGESFPFLRQSPVVLIRYNVSSGSWAFLIGSVMQLYEVIWREPIDKKD